MISLHRAQFPASKGELSQALEKALRHFAEKPSPIVEVRSSSFPHLDEIMINLDGAKLDSSFPPLPRIAGEPKPACEATIVTLSARNISVHGMPMDMRMEAHDVTFQSSKDESGNAVLIFHNARDGILVISTTQMELETAIERLAREQAKKRGMNVDRVRLAMRARSARSLAADAKIQIRKFLLKAGIIIQVQLDVDDDFTAKISELKCRSDSAIGSLARGALEPHLRQLEGRTFSLKSLPFSGIQLHNLRVAVADTVELTADFGSHLK
jgi:hypothetical protein